MLRRIKSIIKNSMLTMAFFMFLLFFSGYSHAENTDLEQSGEDWSFSADGVMTIESNQGWANCLKTGFEGNPWKLIIGKDVTYFRMYNLPEDLPSADFFEPEDIIGYGSLGNPVYDYTEIEGLFPSEIVVEDGNPVFRVVDGLLINTETKELVLSKMGVKYVVIPDGIKKITKDAFYNRDLATVQFPSSLESIGEYAFAKCENLTSVDLPDSLIQLGEGAFAMCSALDDVMLSRNLKIIDMHTFHACPINAIEIPSSVEEIGGWAFFDCEKLQKITLSSGLKKIGRSAFCNCKQLQSTNLPEGLESIGESAFDSCYNLKRVVLPDSLQQIANKAFWGCQLTVLRIPEKLTFLVYDQRHWKYIVNSHSKKDKTFDLSSVDTVILSGSDYDFGYPAISHAHNVYFLGKPPEDVGQILDENSVESIFCSDEFEFEWTRSTVASWVRQRLTILPAEQIKELTQTEINATPEPTNTPEPTPTSSPTPWPTPMPRPTVSPAATAEPEQQEIDPIIVLLIVFIVLVIAAVVLLTLKPWVKKKKKRREKRRKVSQLSAGTPNPNETPEIEQTDKPE